MKKNTIPAILVLAFSLVVIVGSQTFLSACVHEDGTFGACHWAQRALLGLGCVTGILAVLALLVERARPGIYLSLMPCALLGILTPGTLIDLCHMATMRCQAIMRPAMMILYAAVLLSSLIGVALSRER
ncbi:MAG: DUF4418 family protein [Clostridia bacterium]|nr:DUF4418 family protein [Clostridia bacterium]